MLNRLFGAKKTNSSNFDDYYLDNKRIQENHYCIVESYNKSKEIIKREIVNKDFDSSVLEQKLNEWNDSSILKVKTIPLLDSAEWNYSKIDT